MIHEIKLKYLRDIEPIVKRSYGDWIDLRCAETTILHKGEYALIPLGVAMELPQGCEAYIVPRSSTFKRYGIIQTNSMGVIDELYCGDNDEWCMPVYATRDTVINKNDRICQFRIQYNMPTLMFNIVDTLDNVDRHGFGSTGV